MNGKHQIQRSFEMDAPREVVWAILEDSASLPQWAPAVEEVNSRAAGPEERGSLRECRVDFAGRKGTIVERCVDLVPNSRIGYVVDDDSLGFNRMFADYGFTITLHDAAAQRTRVVMDTYYTPRNVLTAAMNVLVMRRKFQKTVDAILQGLSRLAGERAGLRATQTAETPTLAGLPQRAREDSNL
jgi:uncharacterized protein YndB with AHSA1/START domain